MTTIRRRRWLLVMVGCLAALGPASRLGRAQEPPSELTWSFEGLRQFERLTSGCAPSVGLHGFAVAGDTFAAGWSVSNCGLPDTGLIASMREGAGDWSTLHQSEVHALYGRPAMTLSPQGHPYYVFAARSTNDTVFIFEEDMAAGALGRRMAVGASQSSQSHPNISATFEAGAAGPTFAWAARTGFGGPLMLGVPGGEVAIATLATYSVDNDGPHVAAYANHTAGPGVYYSPGISGDLRPVLATTQSGGVSIARAADGRIHLASSGGRSLTGVDDTRLVALSSLDGHAWDRTEIDGSNTRNPSLAVDSFGNPAIAYVKNDAELRIARRVNGAWQHALVAALPLGDGSAMPHLAFDAADRPHVLFYDPATQTIMLARGDAAVTARTLTVSKVGAGTGHVLSAPAGVACGAVCQASFAPGQRVLLEASAAPGSAFDGWGGTCTGTGPCLVTMNAAASVVATFVTTRPPIEVSPPGGGGCSLANAIASANADASIGGCAAGSGADVIHVPAGIYQLTVADNTTHGMPTGLPIITSDIRLIGDGPETTIIERVSGSPAFRLLRVFFTAGSRLTLEGVTLRGGHGGDSGGGAIYTNNPTVIRNSLFADNHAGTSVGGAIRSSSALTISGSVFSSNLAPAGEGGAIYSVGTIVDPLTITTSNFFGNSALWGGALYYSTSAPHASAGVIANSIFDGNTARLGGGAAVASAQTMLRVTVTRNRVTAPGSGGGGLFVSGTTILDSTITDNTVSGDAGGGGVLNSGGTLTIQDTTIARNVAHFGGGASISGTATLSNVTVSGNRSVTFGGGIVQGGRADLQNVTVVDNEAGTVGGGIVSSGFAMISLQNSIVALNRGGPDYPDCYSSGYPLVSTGHNLIGNRASCPYTSGPGDLVGTALLPIAPGLGPLQDNGGASFTHLPALDSPAVDAGNPLPVGDAITACAAADQRGVERPQRAACDIGAVERANAAPVSAAQSIFLAEDMTGIITLSALDADGDSFTFTIVEPPAHGTLSGSGPEVSYTPSADFNGTDSFSFAAVDSFGTTGAPATVSINVIPVNDPPRAVDDTINVPANGGARPVPVLDNDSTPDAGEVLTILDVTPPAHGTLAYGIARTSLEYTPDANYSGVDTFTYTIADGTTLTATARVIVAVVPTADLAAAVSVASPSAMSGGAMAYTGTVTNHGIVDAELATVNFTFPAPPVVVSMPPGCGVTQRFILCGVGTVGVGQSASVEVAVEAPNAASITTTVSVGAAEMDPQQANNTASVTTPITPAADLVLTVVDEPDPVAAGDSLTYRVTVRNRAGVAATNVVVAATMPTTAGFTELTEYTLGPLAVGSDVTTLIVRVPQTAGLYNSHFVVSGAEPDPNPANNTRVEQTIVGSAVAVVNSAGDAGDLNPMDAACDTGAGVGGPECTLRAAIQTANNSPGTIIAFRIPVAERGFADGVFTIQPAINLPPITANGTVIEATSQTAFTGDTNPMGPEIVLRGSSNRDESPTGLRLEASNVMVRGLVINGFDDGTACSVTCGRGILVQSETEFLSAPRIEASYIGVDPTGTSARPNGRGIELGLVVTDAVIGGTAAGAGNLISGNAHSAIHLGGDVIDRTTIQGNLIGTNRHGTAAIPNGTAGAIVIQGAHHTTIGGAANGARNLISGNSGFGIVAISQLREVPEVGVHTSIEGNLIGTDITGTLALGNEAGVLLSGDGQWLGGRTPGIHNVIAGNRASGVVVAGGGRSFVMGNYIGTDVTGVLPLPNGGATGGDAGVKVTSGTSTIGGTGFGESNVIAFNDGDGIRVALPQPNIPASALIQANAIHGNTGFGIDVGADGVSPNDVLDVDDVQNAPRVAVAASPAGSVIAGWLETAANRSYEVELFANAQCSASGYGEGQIPIGRATVVTDAAGKGRFRVEMPIALASTPFLTATATSADGRTSEFSACAPLNGAGTADVRTSVEATPNPASAGSVVSWRMTVTNDGPADATDIVATMSFFGAVGYFGEPQGCSRSDDRFTCTLANLTVGSSHVFDVSAAPQEPGPVMSTVRAKGFEPDPLPANDAAFVIVQATVAADLTVQISGLASPQTSHEVTYAVTVNNLGGATAENVVLAVTLPPGAASVSAPSCTVSGATVTCGLGSLALNHSIVKEISFIPTVIGAVNLVANVSSDTDDSNAGNNTAVHALAVVSGEADVAVLLTASKASVHAGERFTYHFTLTNHGPLDATLVAATLTLPPTLIIDESAGCWAVEGQVATLRAVNLPADTSIECELTVHGDEAGVAAVTATVSSNGGPPDLITDNNTVTVTTTNLGPLVIEVTEAIGVVDQPLVTPALMIEVAEQIGVADEPLVTPALMIEIVEPIGVNDVAEPAVHNTVPGANVVVQPIDQATGTAPISVAFSTVTAPGSTTVSSSSTGPAIPAGFGAGNPSVFYDIATTAGYTGSLTVCINYAGVSFAPSNNPRLFHFENGAWVDRTSSVNTATTTICAGVTSLSPFAIFTDTITEVEGRMTGAGEIADAANREHSFQIRIAERALGDERGRLKYSVKTPKVGKHKATTDTFESTSIGPIAFWDDPDRRSGRSRRAPTTDSATFAGTGRWNGTTGFTFEAQVTDQGEPGRGRDTFAITIRDAQGVIVATAGGTLTSGNIQSTRLGKQ